MATPIRPPPGSLRTRHTSSASASVSGAKRTRSEADPHAAYECLGCNKTRQVYTCKDGHNYCRECAPGPFCQCPSCPVRSLLTRFLNVALLVAGILATAGLRLCKFGVKGSADGCQELLETNSEAAAAHEAGCGFRTVPCPHAGCHSPILAKDLARHRGEDCLFRRVKCGYAGCGAELRASDLEAHKGSCGHRPMTCPSCNAKVPQGVMVPHLRDAHGAKFVDGTNRTSASGVFEIKILPGDAPKVTGTLLILTEPNDYVLIALRLKSNRGPPLLEISTRVWQRGVQPNTPSSLPASLVGGVRLSFSPVNDDTVKVSYLLPVGGPPLELDARHLFGALGHPNANSRKCTMKATLTATWNLG